MIKLEILFNLHWIILMLFVELTSNQYHLQDVHPLIK